MAAAQNGILEGGATRLCFVLGNGLQSKARESATKLQGQNPMIAGAMQSVAGLQSVAFSAKASDRISMQLAGAFSSAQEALQMKTMMDAMVLGMGKMMLMQALGRPIPFIESLTSRQDGTTLALVGDLTAEDCRALLELQAKKMQGPAAVPGPAEVPAAAPVGVPAAPAI
jgi:hypothetical protein